MIRVSYTPGLWKWTGGFCFMVIGIGVSAVYQWCDNENLNYLGDGKGYELKP
jgi:hypothetical protein